MADNTTSFQIESVSGKRSKVKASNVLLRFTEPGMDAFIPQAEVLAADIDTQFLWECCPLDEFGFEQIATEYFGHAPSALEATAALLCLHGAPIYFHRKGKGRFRAAPPEVLKAALAGAERKRKLLELQAKLTEQLIRFELPLDFSEKLNPILFKPDRNTVEVRALEAACAATHLSAAHLLHRCGAIPSTHDFHLQRFLFEHFPGGTGFPHVELDTWAELPSANVRAFSIDDSTTTEIDDAFSVQSMANGNWRVGIHIAAPALGIMRDSTGDKVAAQRLSTVYMPGNKITMLPEHAIEAFTLRADHVCPVLSMYLDVDAQSLSILSLTSSIETIRVATNLRHETLEPLFNEESLTAGHVDYPFSGELRLLWKLACKLESDRGKPADNSVQQVDYNFHVENDRVRITQRRRGTPIDKVVSELMILVNSEWGRLISEHDFTAIYRTQNNGKVRMSTAAAPHQGLGVAQYMWSSSPLRRYVDMINQRQIIAMLRGDEPVYSKNDTAIYAAMRDFDTMYSIYGEFQRNMERYWCLRWLEQEEIAEVEAIVLRENLVKLTAIPLVFRAPSLPDLPSNARVRLAIAAIDLLEMNLQTRFISTVEETTCPV